MAWRWRRSTPRQAHENGDGEQSHNRFKEAVDQALLLRGSRDFVNRAAYARFLRDIVDHAMPGANAVRRGMGRAPPAPCGTDGELQAMASSGPFRQHHSCGPKHVFGRQQVDRRAGGRSALCRRVGGLVCRQDDGADFPVGGQGKHRINYRHVIDWLVRKPGAFENYRYREDLFPTSRFRMAYDALRGIAPSRASREYLGILN